MSNAASENASQTPRQEVLDRLAEQSPSLGLPRLLGIEHLQRMLADARNRVTDSHRVQMKALGEKPEELAKSDDMGISVAGDTTINIVQPGEQKESAVAGLMKKALPLVAAAAIGGGVASAPTLLQLFRAFVQTPAPADSSYDVLFYDKDGNLIDVPRKPQ
jgi:hypothetical protein